MSLGLCPQSLESSDLNTKRSKQQHIKVSCWCWKCIYQIAQVEGQNRGRQQLSGGVGGHEKKEALKPTREREWLPFTNNETWSKSLNMLIVPFSSNEENNISYKLRGYLNTLLWALSTRLDLANKNSGHPIKCGIQMNNEYFFGTSIVPNKYVILYIIQQPVLCITKQNSCCC